MQYCGITEKKVLRLTRLEQLEELVFGKESDYAGNPGAHVSNYPRQTEEPKSAPDARA